MKWLWLVIGVFSLVMAGAGAIWLHESQVSKLETQFNDEVYRIVDDIQRRFTQPVYGLKGARGAYAAAGVVDRAAFRRYVSSRDLEAEFPGVRGMGFIERVARSDLSAFIDRARAEGAPDFAVKTLPGGSEDLPELWVIKYIEPVSNNRQAVGLDIASEANRRQAAQRAAASGLPALTRSIRLVQDNHSRPGFLIFVPVYARDASITSARERQAAFAGLMYSPVVLEELLAPALDVIEASGLTLEVLESSTEGRWETLFRASEASSHTPLLVKDVPFGDMGADLMFRVSSTPAFDARVNRDAVFAVAGLGVAFSVLLSWALWLMTHARYRAENEARKLSQDVRKLARVAESTSNAVTMMDLDGRITWVNQGFSAISGYTPQEAIGKTHAELVASPQVDVQALRALHRARHEGSSCRVELENTSKEGRSYWLDIDLQPIRDEAGTLQGFVEVAQDVTSERRRNARLREVNHVLELQRNDLDVLSRVAKATSNAVVLTDTGGLITWVNEGFTRVTGYTLEEARGQRPGDFLQCPETDPQTIRELGDAIRRLQPCRVEILNRAKDGHTYWLDVELQPIFNDEGRHSGFMAIESDITERKRNRAELEEALQDNERARDALEIQRKRLDLIIRGTNVGTWEWHVPSGQTVFNERWADIIGYTLDELGPVNIDTWLSFAHPADLQHSSEMLKKHFDGEAAFYECEARMRHRDGHWVWVLDRGQVASREEDGSPGWMYGTHQDISQRKNAELALKASEFRNRALLTLSAQWFWQTDAEHRFVAFECADPQRLALLNAVGLGRCRWDMGHEAVGFSWADHQDQLRRHESFNHLVYRRVEANGEVRYWSVGGVPVFGDDGAFTGYIGMGSDITRQKEDELRVLRSEAMLERTGELAQVGAWRMELPDGQPEWSAQTCRIHEVPVGYRPSVEEALSFYAPEARPVITDLVSKGVASGEGWDVELPFITAKGRRIWVRTIGKAEVDDQGRPVALAGGFQDVTAQREQADALREAKAQAESASLAKSQFLANMSHEIRTPMNAILGLLRLLQDTSLNAHQRDCVKKTEGAAKSLLGILNDILDVSKVEAGKMTLDPQPFSLDVLLRDLGVIFASSVGAKPIEVLFDVDPDIPRRLVGDSLRLQQILINLVGNAIKFTAAGEVVLRLRLTSLDRSSQTPAAHLSLEVSDTGIGIAPEHQEKIFAGFSQAEASTTRRFGGTGLGLHISRRLVELMGGSIALTSVPGQGTTFRIDLCLPLAEGVEASSPAVPEGAGLPVLMVDDNRTAREIFVRIGASLGWRAGTAASEPEAMDEIHTRLKAGDPYEVVYIDAGLPGAGALALVEQIRSAYGPQGSRRAEAHPVVILIRSSDAHGPLQSPASKDLGDIREISKPVTASMLFDALQDAMADQGTTTGGHALAPTSRPLAGWRLLLAEDNVINQQVAQGLLEAQGALVVVADNGRKAVEAVSRSMTDGHRFDAILMDMQMPEMDGLEATRNIRESLGVTDTPIIAMTANAMASDRQACLAAGMNDHVGKPFDIDALVNTLRRWARRSEMTSESVPGEETPSSQPLPWLDRRAALGRVGSDAALLDRMSRHFVHELPALMERCESAAGEGDVARLRQTLHNIKGAASTLGAVHLAAVAHEGEQVCLLGQVPSLAPLRQSADATTLAWREAGVEDGHPPWTKAAPSAIPTVWSERDRQVLGRMRVMLAESQMDVFNVLERLKASSPEHQTQWHALEEAMSAMDFSAAGRLVDAWLAPAGLDAERDGGLPPTPSVNHESMD